MLEGPRSCMPELARNSTSPVYSHLPPHALLSFPTQHLVLVLVPTCLHTPILSTTIDSIAPASRTCLASITLISFDTDIGSYTGELDSSQLTHFFPCYLIYYQLQVLCPCFPDLACFLYSRYCYFRVIKY